MARKASTRSEAAADARLATMLEARRQDLLGKADDLAEVKQQIKDLMDRAEEITYSARETYGMPDEISIPNGVWYSNLELRRIIDWLTHEAGPDRAAADVAEAKAEAARAVQDRKNAKGRGRAKRAGLGYIECGGNPLEYPCED